MTELGHDLDALLAQEEEPGLGNGGLGRLAACYMDSLATLEIPTLGYGIRYEFGIFDQAIRDGWQVEKTDKWLRPRQPVGDRAARDRLRRGLGGHTEGFQDEQGLPRALGARARRARGRLRHPDPRATATATANLLRLWKAEAAESFDFEAFNVGDYWGAVEEKVASENITKVLYPNDELVRGKRLRLEQQYFFVSCSLQDMIRIYLQREKDLSDFHEKYAVQLNDTHPALAVAELMRLLVDEHAMGWDEAWEITRRPSPTRTTPCCPRRSRGGRSRCSARCCRGTSRSSTRSTGASSTRSAPRPGDEGLVRPLSLIDESGGRSVRMAHLASVGSHRINGVAALHTSC
jgi:glycogen phosphorylase